MRGGGERDRVWDDQAGHKLGGRRRGLYMGMDLGATVCVCVCVCGCVLVWGCGCVSVVV